METTEINDPVYHLHYSTLRMDVTEMPSSLPHNVFKKIEILKYITLKGLNQVSGM